MLLPKDRPVPVHCILSSKRESNRVNEYSNSTTPIGLHQLPIGWLYRQSLLWQVHRTSEGIEFNHTISLHHQLRLPALLIIWTGLSRRRLRGILSPDCRLMSASNWPDGQKRDILHPGPTREQPRHLMDPTNSLPAPWPSLDGWKILAVISGYFTNGTVSLVVTNSLSPLNGQHLGSGNEVTE